MTPAIEVEAVSRWFGELVALRDVTCGVHAGVTIVSGSNGAGKSTLLAVMAGVLRPSAGSVRVLGKDPARSAAVFSDLGYVPQGTALPDDLTPRQLLTFATRTTRGWRPARAAAADLLASFGLEAVADRPVAACSNGNRQRVRTAMALAGDPRVIVLDEPFVGLDGPHRDLLAERLRDLAAEGRSVVVSSHVGTALDAVAGQVLTLDRGRLAAAGAGTLVRIEAVGAADLASRLLRAGLATRIDAVHAGTITFETPDPEDLAARVVRIAALSGTRIDRLVTGARAAGAT